MTYNPQNIRTNEDLKRSVENNCLVGDIIIRGEHINSLGELVEIKGFLGLSDSNIESLGKLKRIEGDFWISHSNVPPNLYSLGELEEVTGTMNLRYSSIQDLSKLTLVIGSVNLRDTPLLSFGRLKEVKGDLFLPDRFKNDKRIETIQVEGKIKFWKDSKRQVSIAQKPTLFAYEVPAWPHQYIYGRESIEALNSDQKQFYNEFKQAFLNGEYWDLNGYTNYAFALLYEIDYMFPTKISLDKYRVYHSALRDCYPVTRPYSESLEVDALMSQNLYLEAWNIINLHEFINLENLHKFINILDVSIASPEVIQKIAGIAYLTEFGRSNISLVQQQLNSMPQLVNTLQAFATNAFNYDSNSETIKSFQELFRQAEDEFRVSNGMPKIGEGWISETNLFYQITQAFPKFKVIHHGSPSWLGRQHLDIEIPDIKLGIEYQGAQHYQPIEFFGGEIALEKTKERDRRKKALCLQNGYNLIIVDEGYDFEEVRMKIKAAKFLS